MKSSTSITTFIRKAAILFILMTGILTACAPGEKSKNLQEGTPTVEVTETIEPIVEFTPTEMPPEVDLGWHDDWELFDGLWRRSAEELEAWSSGRYENRPVYMIFSIKNGLFNDIMNDPYDEEDLITYDLVNRLNENFKFNLDDKGKELLKQFILSRASDGVEARLILYIEDSCIYEQNGSLGLIKKAENKKGVEVFLYGQEDIPWYSIPKEYWDDIAVGYTLVDMSGDVVVCSCNINDIRASSTEK